MAITVRTQRPWDIRNCPHTPDDPVKDPRSLPPGTYQMERVKDAFGYVWLVLEDDREWGLRESTWKTWSKHPGDGKWYIEIVEAA